MYKGKRVKRGTSRKKPALLVASLALLLSVSVMGTLAFLVATSGAVKNTFELAEVPIEVVENGANGEGNFTGTIKTNVKIKHIGDETDADAYIRAAVVATWVKENESGGFDVYGAAPKEGADYSMTWGEGTGWTKSSDGYYYYSGKVAPGGTTGILIKECEASVPAPADGYQLSVEIIAQSIQADGVNDADKTPVELAWGIDAAKLVGAVAESSGKEG